MAVAINALGSSEKVPGCSLGLSARVLPPRRARPSTALRCHSNHTKAPVRTTIQRLNKFTIGPTANLLATAFSEASNMRAYHTFLRRRITSYLQDCSTRLRNDCICLVAVAEADEELPGDSFKSEESDSTSVAETPQVVGTVMLSFNERSREAFVMLKPPPHSILLTNMAVDKNFQRRGIATQLLEACEEYCSRYTRERRICLHVRWRDEPANQLYMCAPF